MKMRQISILLFETFLGALLLSACDKVGRGGEPGDEEIVFRTKDNWGDEILEDAHTKAVPKQSFVSGDNMVVFAYYVPAGGSLASNGRKYFENQEVTYNGSTWSYSPPYYYPVEGSLYFRAYSPMRTASNGIALNSTSGGLSLSYSIPSSPVNNPDLMVAKVDDKSSGSVNFTGANEFKHILSSVAFVVGDYMDAGFALTGITFSGIVTGGTYDYDSGWTLNPGTGNVSYLASGSSKLYESTGTETSGSSLIGVQTFMVLPQTFNSGAEIVINYQKKTDGVYEDATPVTISLSGSAFMAGNFYAYKISYRDSKLTLSVGATEFSPSEW